MYTAEEIIAYEARRDSLRRQIDESLRKVGAYQGRLKQAERRYSITHIALTGTAGAIAGFPAATGVLPDGNWRFVCALAAVAAFGATAVGTIQKQFSEPESLVKSSECLGKLRLLKVEAVAPGFNVDLLGGKYQQLLAEYSDIDY